MEEIALEKLRRSVEPPRFNIVDVRNAARILDMEDAVTKHPEWQKLRGANTIEIDRLSEESFLALVKCMARVFGVNHTMLLEE